MHKLAVGALLLALAAALVAATGGPERGVASSHREAPLISEDPAADNTDLYAFRSPDKPDTITIISNVIPGEDPAAGPNWYRFAAWPTARYSIHIDRSGDARADVTYRFRFRNRAGTAFLGNSAQDYDVTRIVGRQSRIIARGTTAPNNIGPKSTPNYRTLAAGAVANMDGGGLAFAGQREDGFYGDIGSIFDLVSFRRGTGNVGGGKDFFAGYAVHAFALQIPIAQLDDADHTVGIWTTVDRQTVRVQRTRGRVVVTRPYVQVSRLGNPLVNEVVIPTNRKDEWNGDAPRQESKYGELYRQPLLASVVNQLYPGVVNAPERDRADLVAVLLTGVPSLNFTGNTQADMLRLNMSIPPTAKPNRLGVIGGDNAGWPNGRRLEDDVIDIAVRAVAGKLMGNPVADVLGDGVDANDVQNLSFFPYEADPFSGFANTKGEQKP